MCAYTNTHHFFFICSSTDGHLGCFSHSQLVCPPPTHLAYFLCLPIVPPTFSTSWLQMKERHFRARAARAGQEQEEHGKWECFYEKMVEITSHPVPLSPGFLLTICPSSCVCFLSISPTLQGSTKNWRGYFGKMGCGGVKEKWIPVVFLLLHFSRTEQSHPSRKKSTIAVSPSERPLQVKYKIAHVLLNLSKLKMLKIT